MEREQARERGAAVEYSSGGLRACLVHAFTLPQLATPDFRSCLVHAEPAPNLQHAATTQALSSSFGMPTHAAVRAAGFIAAFLARLHHRQRS